MSGGPPVVVNTMAARSQLLVAAKPVAPLVLKLNQGEAGTRGGRSAAKAVVPPILKLGEGSQRMAVVRPVLLNKLMRPSNFQAQRGIRHVTALLKSVVTKLALA